MGLQGALETDSKPSSGITDLFQITAPPALCDLICQLRLTLNHGDQINCYLTGLF